MFNVRHAAVEVSGMKVYPDASGAPAVVRIGPYGYACDYIKGEVRCALISPVAGSRVESKIAAERARREYAKHLVDCTTSHWRKANVTLYLEVVA